MSKNLGPVHYMMYEKIKFQDKITNFLLDGNTEAVDKDFAPVKDLPLEDLIDQDNIHGWLSARIDQVENRLAKAMALSANPREKMYELGKLEGEGEDLSNLKLVFDKLNQRMLDGMPCDRALRAGIDEEGNLLLITDNNLHAKYQTEAINPEDSLDDTCEGGHDHDHHESFEVGKVSGENLKNENSTYHDLRLAFIEGFLEESPYEVELVNGINYKIKEREN